MLLYEQRYPYEQCYCHSIFAVRTSFCGEQQCQFDNALHHQMGTSPVGSLTVACLTKTYLSRQLYSPGLLQVYRIEVSV